MKTDWTILHLRILLHAATSPTPFSPKTEISDKYAEELREADLIRLTEHDTYHVLTNRGAAYVQLLRTCPLPEMAWVGANGMKVLPRIEAPEC